jgi:hypothetical protein
MAVAAASPSVTAGPDFTPHIAEPDDAARSKAGSRPWIVAPFQKQLRTSGAICRRKSMIYPDGALLPI